MCQDVYLPHTLSLCVCAISRLNDSYHIKAQGESTFTVSSYSHAHTADMKRLINMLVTHSLVRLRNGS